MTIMVYLNEVEEGGETAFPIANNDTYDDHVSTNNDANSICDSAYCKGTSCWKT